VHNPRQSDLTTVRGTQQRVALSGEVPVVDFAHVTIPNPDALVPPGYYVSATAEVGPCAHCGAIEPAHLEVQRFCPLPPLEFRELPERAA
jgi:hypothetical protein